MWRQIVTNLLTTWLEKVQPQEIPQVTLPEEKKQKKPWAALSEKERQAVRESWKYELPDEYDVYCIKGVFSPKIHSTSELVIPGRFYATGNVMCKHSFATDDSCIIDGSAKCFNLNVGGKLYIGGSAKTDDLILADEAVICGYTDCENIDTLGDFTSYGDVSCDSIKSKKNITIDGNMDCTRADIKGFLDVNGDASSSGKVNVEGGIIIAGDTDFEDVYSGEDFTVRGHAKCGDVYAKGNITFEDGADCLDVEAEGKITAKGKIHFESTIADSLDL